VTYARLVIYIGLPYVWINLREGSAAEQSEAVNQRSGMQGLYHKQSARATFA